MTFATAHKSSSHRGVRVELAKLEDLDRIVGLHIEQFTGAGNLLVLLGPAFVTAAYRWFLTTPGAFVLVARSHGDIVGFTSVYERPYTGPMLRACWRHAAYSLGSRPWLLLHSEVLSRISRLILQRPATAARGAAQIAFTAVRTQHRGMGVGRELKEASLRESRRRGMKALVTAVRRNNVASRRMNEGVGFKEVEELGDKHYCYYLIRLSQERLHKVGEDYS